MNPWNQKEKDENCKILAFKLSGRSWLTLSLVLITKIGLKQLATCSALPTGQRKRLFGRDPFSSQSKKQSKVHSTKTKFGETGGPGQSSFRLNQLPGQFFVYNLLFLLMTQREFEFHKLRGC
jgi:hypothetical protein